jgi:hypothetical protein
VCSEFNWEVRRSLGIREYGWEEIVKINVIEREGKFKFFFARSSV